MRKQTDPFKKYISRMALVRRLSTPSLEGIPDADSYSDRLKDNFVKIGTLAEENRSFLNKDFFPVIQKEDLLTEDETKQLAGFGSSLIDADTAENLDLPILSVLSERLLNDARSKEDLNTLIRRLDVRYDTCYALMSMTGRITAAPEIADQYRKAGIETASFFLSLLEPEQFVKITDVHCRETVLTNSRYAAVFYEGTPADENGSGKDLEILERMLEISEDPFYHRQVPNFNWRYFRYRTLHYYAKSTDFHNIRGFSHSILQRILRRTKDYWDFWHSDPGYFSRFDSEKEVRMVYSRNQYLAGEKTAGEFRKVLSDTYLCRNEHDYSLNGIYDNLLIPAEFIGLIRNDMISEDDQLQLRLIYQDMLRYIFRMPNSESLSSLLEYCVKIISTYIEVPGGMTFEDMGLQCMAALHPPTYLHSLMVAQLSECIAAHAVDICPDQLMGVLGCQSAAEVQEKKIAISQFAYHSALCHDFGKLTIIDTVLVYGRNLLDMEFGLIQTHPKSGYELLKKYPSTSSYADIALYHHRYYNDQAGYPKDERASDSPLKSLIDLVHCADCLDAATDAVGRSYHRSKTLEDVLKEFRKDSGIVYAPWVCELLQRPEVKKDISHLLTEGRKTNYRNTYYLLQYMQNPYA